MAYLNEFFVLCEVWQLLVFELSSLVKVLTDQELQIRAIDRLIISLQKMSDECSINHLLFTSGLSSYKFDES